MEEKTKANKELIKSGEYWNSFFYRHLGYRIAEDEDDYRVLGLAMIEVLKEAKEEERERIIKDFNKLRELDKKPKDKLLRLGLYFNVGKTFGKLKTQKEE